MTSFLPGVLLQLLQQLLAVGHILVAENLDGGPRKPRAVNDAGVVQLVGEDEVLFAENRAHRAGVGRKAALEDHAGLNIFEARNLLFELHVDAHGSGDGAHRARAHAEGPRGRDGRFNQLGVVGQAEIVVAGQVDHLAAVVVANRRLLVVEHAEIEVRALGAQLVKNGGQVCKLGAGCGFCHGGAPTHKSIARLRGCIPAGHASKRRLAIRLPGWPGCAPARYNRGLHRVIRPGAAGR